MTKHRMNPEDIRTWLFDHADQAYAAFQRKLLPTIPPDTIIGIRTPDLRRCAKEWTKQGDLTAFLNALPHTYFDENQLHAFVLCGIKDYTLLLERLKAFLPYIDNWATCDQLSPPVLKKHTNKLMPVIDRWLASEKTYTIRFAIGMLMRYYLDEHFSLACADRVAAVRSEEYYVNMMVAWYFATALAKQYDAILPYLTDRRLSTWTHNKAIQKAIESRRITSEQKEALRALKIRR